MAKKYTHFNNSGSNHKIFDAESAYVTGTLQVGPAIPTLGSDVNFFVSGNIGGKDGATPGVGVFGGDLVVSGNLHFLGGITGSIPAGASYWTSPVLGVIKAEASSSMVEVPHLSASNGAEISGSTTFNVIGNTAYSVVISGTNAFGQAPAFQVVSTGIVPGTVFSIDGDSGTTQVENNYDQLLNPEPGFAYARLDAGRIKTAWSGSSVSIKADQGNPAEIELITSGGTGFTNAIIRSWDEGAIPIDLDLRIRALQINGDPGIAGYVLTSSGPGVSPGWAPVATPAVVSEYWFSSGSNEIATTGSVALVGGDYPTNNKASDYGSDVFFFVSGNNGGVVAGNGVAVFGGDVVVSGALYAKDDVDVVGKLVVSGNAVFAQGMTGSIPWVDEAGTLPFLVAGPNATVNFLSNGQWAITGADESQPEWYYTANTGEIATSGSAAITGSLAVTGAAYFSPAGTGRGLLNFGGLDIGPITGSITIVSGTQTSYLGVDILSASNGAGPKAVVEHEIHVLAVGALTNSSGIVDHFFSATYLVTSKIDGSGIQSLIGSVELTRESSGSFVNQWDVNVESDMKVALTGTMNNNSLNEVRWFVERTRERSKKW